MKDNITPQFLFGSENVVSYCESTTTDEPSLCRDIRLAARGHEKSHWITGPLVGTLLRLLSLSPNVNHVLEIGTFLGYSAAYMAFENPTVEITTLEHDQETADAARLTFSQAGCSNVAVVHADGLDWLQANSTATFDMIFFDANRTRVLDYFLPMDAVLEDGGFIVMDNALLRGHVLEPRKEWEKQSAEFARLMKSDGRYLTTTLPIRDGILLAMKQTKRTDAV